MCRVTVFFHALCFWLTHSHSHSPFRERGSKRTLENERETNMNHFASRLPLTICLAFSPGAWESSRSFVDPNSGSCRRADQQQQHLLPPHKTSCYDVAQCGTGERSKSKTWFSFRLVLSSDVWVAYMNIHCERIESESECQWNIKRRKNYGMAWHEDLRDVHTACILDMPSCITFRPHGVHGKLVWFGISSLCQAFQ